MLPPWHGEPSGIFFFLLSYEDDKIKWKRIAKSVAGTGNTVFSRLIN